MILGMTMNVLQKFLMTRKQYSVPAN